MRTTALFATFALALTTASGCYMGRTKSAKTGAYVMNGVVAGLGAILIASPAGHHDNSNEDVSGGFSLSLRDDAKATIGTMLVVGALVAATATFLAPTLEDAPRTPAPLTMQPAQRGTVTAPGLTPATVTLR